MTRLAIFVLLALPALVLAADPPHTAAVEGAAHSAAVDHGGGGKVTPFAGTIAQSIAAIVVFLVVFFVLKTKAWGPILKGLNDRENRIRGDLEAADKAHAAARMELENYKKQLAGAEAQIRQMLAKAQQDAEGLAAGIKVKAQQDAEEIKERATKEIEASKNAALSELHEHAASLATSVASKILRRNITPDDQRDLVRSSLDELQTVASR